MNDDYKSLYEAQEGLSYQLSNTISLQTKEIKLLETENKLLKQENEKLKEVNQLLT